ncbi:phage tail protein [Gilliamella apicola]|uniref:phage tail protein n=1 Tax=Gilliamella apicola TaxID=1196095 RepID=UPI001C0E997B|nr:phage tail protein [Gilliamella apicola]
MSGENMETFNWDVAPNMTVRSEPRVKTIKFGDGYEQRAPDGINNKLRSYNVTLNVARSTSRQIDDFLDRHGGVTAFQWRDPHSNRILTVKCPSWSINLLHTTASITATFEEVVA